MTTLHLEPGQILNNRYRLERLLGKGGMGQVFLSHDLSGGTRVALKTFQEVMDETDRRRFEREIRTLQTLKHPHIITFRDLGWIGDALFFTMDYQPGVTLEDVLAANGMARTPADLRWHLRLVIQLMEALSYLHSRRIVHRDVKPSNILLRASAFDDTFPPAAEWLGIEPVTAYLTDFGLAKTREHEGSLTHTAMGTPQYMSPEQIEASPAIDERSDLYSAGVILYRAVTGKLPFERLSDALARKPATSPRELNPAVPELLDEVIRRLLEFEPYRRPASAEEVIQLLRVVLDHRGEHLLGAPVPAKLAQPSFCGRARELRLLKDAAREAARGNGRWVSITGERGTGKTWLTTRSDIKSHALVAEGLTVYTGAFDPKRPHAGFREVIVAVLRHIERHHGASHITEVLGRWGRHLSTIAPELNQHGWLDACPIEEEVVPQEVLNERLFETVVRILTAGAEIEPRVFILDDLQHLDDFDLELFRRFVINALPLPVLIVTAHRPEVGGRLRPLERFLKECQSEGRLIELELPPFGSEEVRAMVESLLTPARPVPDAFVRVLEQRTDGVPLYLLHLLNSIWNRGMIRLTPDHWEVDEEAVRNLPIPETTRSHFLLVLDELPSQELRVLNLAAVLGTRFPFDVLLDLMDIDEFELDAVCRNLVHAGLLVEHQDGFRFPHVFEQEIILSRLSRHMFRRLHLRVGTVLEAFYGDTLEKHLGEIAEHMYLGGEQEKGLEYLCRAARKAEESYSLRTALEYYSKALELTQDPMARRDLLNAVGELHIRLGEPDQALAHFRSAIQHFTAVEKTLLDRAALSGEERTAVVAYAKLLLRFGEVYVRQGDFPLALENFQKAERFSRLIEDSEMLAFALVRQGGAYYSLEDPARAEEAFTTAVRLYKGLPPSSGLVSALGGLGLLEKMRGNFDEALEYATQALDIARKIGDSVLTAGVLNNFGTLYRSLGRLREAVESFERSIEIQERIGDRQGLARGFMNLGRAQSSLGDFRRSREALTRAQGLFQAIGDKKGTTLTVGNLGMLEYYRGDFATARSFLHQYLGDSRALGSLRGEADARNSLGLVELDQENYTLAEECFEHSLKCFQQAGDREGVLVNRLHLARVRGRQQRPQEALEILSDVRAQAAAMDSPEVAAQALRVEAEAQRALGDLESARARAEEALASFEDQALPYQQGVCCRTLGKIYRDMGFYWADQAAKYFERAVRLFEMLGARHALAVTQVEYGILLGLLEEKPRARELFLKARNVLEELRIPNELDRVRVELDAIG